MKKSIAAFLCFCCLVTSVSFADIEKDQNSLTQTSFVNVTNTIERTSEHQYVKALAAQNNISYELASKMNAVENESILNESNESYLRAAPEVIKYKTVYGQHSISGKTVEMTAEVKYVYSNITKKPESIINITGPYLYILGVSFSSMDGGDYTIEQTLTTGRVSRTANFTYQVSVSVGVQIGFNDIISISPEVGGNVFVTTRAKTYVLNITLSSLS